MTTLEVDNLVSRVCPSNIPVLNSPGLRVRLFFVLVMVAAGCMRATITLEDRMSAFGGKAEVNHYGPKGPLIARSGPFRDGTQKGLFQL
jgi:hypothetical protein